MHTVFRRSRHVKNPAVPEIAAVAEIRGAGQQPGVWTV